MKKIQSLALFAVILLVTVSCGNNKKPSTTWADSYCENLALRMDLCKRSYETYYTLLPQESSEFAGMGAGPAYDVMIKTFDEQKQILTKTEVWDGAEEDVKETQKMKDLTTAVIDIYIDGGKKELANVNKLVSKGYSLQHEEMDEELTSFETRLNEAYAAFGKEQEVYAKKYGIILY